MSEPTTTTEPAPVELPSTGDATFASLMDFLVADADQASGGTGAAAAPAAADVPGQPAPAGEGASAAGAAAPAPAAGDGGEPVVPPAAGAPPAAGEPVVPAPVVDGAGPGAGTVDASTLSAEWGKVSTALEGKANEVAKNEALADAKAEYGEYFDAIAAPPRTMVGKEVPSLTEAGGKEVLRDSQDAADWQAAAQKLLEKEVVDRAQRKIEENAPSLQVLHATVELFQSNHDLVPGAKQFDKELADRFMAMAKPYLMVVDGKPRGFTIPVQPLVDSVRAQLVAERAARPPVPAAAAPAPAAAAGAPAPAATPPAAAPVAAPADAPQAGIPSKAGAGADDSSDFSALWGTIGLPNIRI